MQTVTESPARASRQDKAKELRKRIDDSLDTLAKAVDDVRASETSRAYLANQARVHLYSWHNPLVIMMQRPDASRVAGYQAWKKLGRQVCKGEHGIMIFAPYPWKREVETDRDCLNTVEAWDHAGVALHILDLGGNAIDTTSAAGRFMLVVLAGAAEMERSLTRERTKFAMAVKRANGQRIGTVPYGFDLADDGVTLIENHTEQAVILDLKSMCGQGKKLQEIAASLTERKISTKTGKHRWTHQAVARILARNG